MIQRKQSLFLALAAMLSFATWFFPVSTYVRGEEQFIFMTQGLIGPDGIALEEVAMKMPFHIVLTILGAALAVSIFLYGNRPRQVRLVRGTYLLALATAAFMFITDTSIRSYLAQGGAVTHHYGVSYFLPLLALVLSFLAERAIRADEELVRSMDRLR
jgi:hypothetical protein